MLIHVSLYKENIELISISIALSHCVILNMICRLMQMPMEITLLNPLNDPEHCSLSLPQGPKVNTHNHTHTRRAQISTQGNIEGKVYNELAIESRGSSGSSYWDCVLCVIGNLNKLKLFRTHSTQQTESTHTHIHTRERSAVGVEWCEYVSRCTYINVHMCVTWVRLGGVRSAVSAR